MKTERYKYPPVSTFDIKEIENWLEEMAAEGWFLKEAGPYAWLFEAGEPENVRYRIDPATEKKGKLDEEKRLDYEAMGWRYAATHRDFYHIFMSDDPEAEELHTDEMVESFSARMLEKRLRNELVGGVLVVALMALNGFSVLKALVQYPVLTLIEMRPAMVFYQIFYIIWFVGWISVCVKIYRRRKCLAAGIMPDGETIHTKRESKRKRLWHSAERLSVILLIAGLILSQFPDKSGQAVSMEEHVRTVLTLEKLEGDKDEIQKGGREEEQDIDGEGGNIMWRRFSLFAGNNYEIYDQGDDAAVESGKEGGNSSSLHVMYYRPCFRIMAPQLYSELQKKYLAGCVTETQKLRGVAGEFYIVTGTCEDGTQVAAAMLDGRLLLAEYSGSIKLKDKISLIEEVLVSERRRGF
ncbi:DUF2812 domain-containing protein [[Clostridium] symbiosum]|uniref:DUF2812 domain-containing protein n=1 Tax=Clostridium symbiosum TaxID=1512 RepID=UPI001D096FC6|nr:DUF2812 domain-containing protein [[Clostridium] symbiosum]MCB6608307.1 DUF2812 domain-containing protein [[Clostridium] symbiosum]MCB6932857.1 DUF2812 domain-containing protein [[Clostridium] symbiosum]